MTNRRAKGEGSITKLTNGRYKVRIELTPVNGKRKWLSATVDTKTEAIDKLKTLQRQKEDTEPRNQSTGDIESYIDAYVSYKLSQGVKTTTIHLNKRIIGSVLAPFFAGVPVKTINLGDITALINSWSHLKTSTKRNYIGICKDFFNWLVYSDILTGSPFDRYKTPRRKTVTHKLEVLSSEEHCLLKSVMEHHFDCFKTRQLTSMRYRFYPLYLLAYETGMRAGEIAGLKWSAIEFDKCLVVVNNNVTDSYDGKGFKDSSPKTPAGYRQITVSVSTLDVLKTLKELYMSMGVVSEYVFPSLLADNKGGIFSPAKYSGILRYFMELVGISRPNFTFHSIRHTNASLMVANGVDIGIITERLGHSNITMTLSVYAHVLKDSKDRNVAVVTA